MVSSVLIDRGSEAALEYLLTQESARGTEPGQRVVFCGISWKRYLAFDKKLGDDRPAPRLYYFDSELEIMPSPNDREGMKKWFSDLLGNYFFEMGPEISPRAKAT